MLSQKNQYNFDIKSVILHRKYSNIRLYLSAEKRKLSESEVSRNQIFITFFQNIFYVNLKMIPYYISENISYAYKIRVNSQMIK